MARACNTQDWFQALACWLMGHLGKSVSGFLSVSRAAAAGTEQEVVRLSGRRGGCGGVQAEVDLGAVTRQLSAAGLAPLRMLGDLSDPCSLWTYDPPR